MDGSVTPAEGPWQGIATRPGTEQQTIAFFKIDLGSAVLSYSATTFFTAFMSRQRNTRTVISSANTETFAVRGPAKRIPCRNGFAPSSLSLWSRGSRARTQRRGDKGLVLLDRQLENERPRTPPVYLHNCSRVVVHHAHPSAELRFECGSLQNRCQTSMVKLFKGLGRIKLISAASVPSFIPSMTSLIKCRLS